MADDDQNGEIVTLGKNIHINFWGTILTVNKIKLKDGYCDINEEKDIDFSIKDTITLKEYYKRTLLIKKEYSR